MNRKHISGRIDEGISTSGDETLLSPYDFRKQKTKMDVVSCFRLGLSALSMSSATAEEKVAFLRLAVQRLYELDVAHGIAEAVRDICDSGGIDAFPRKDTYLEMIFLVISRELDFSEILQLYFTGVLQIPPYNTPESGINHVIEKEEFRDSGIMRLFCSMDSLSALLRYITQMRVMVCYRSDIGEIPLENAVTKGLCFEIAEGIFITPVTDSFRRFILYEKDAHGNLRHAVEIKIPGEHAARYDVSSRGYTVAKDIKDSFGSNEVIVDPVMKIETGGEFWIYGKRVRFSEKNPLRIIVFDYIDGLRIDCHFSPTKRNKTIHQLSQRLGLSEHEIKHTIARETLKAVRAVHRKGYVGTTDLRGNPDIPVVKKGAYLRNIFEEHGLDVERLVNLGILETVKQGEGVYMFNSKTLTPAIYYLKTCYGEEEQQELNRIRGILESGLTPEEVDILIAIIKEIKEGTISDFKIMSDMHMGNFKAVICQDGEEQLRVLSVADTETYVRPLDPQVFQRISRLELIHIIQSLKKYGFTFDDQTFDTLLAEADAELDRLDLQ